MAEEKIEVVLNRLYPTFNIKSGEKEATSQFKEITHENLCDAIHYWIDENRLVMVEPTNSFITQSLRDEGVDVILEFLSSNVKIGFQVKSYNDIYDKNFTSTVKAQIATSKKHGIIKLFICLCGDLTDKRQLEKMSGISSEIDEINKTDDYMYILSPLKMIQIYTAYRQNKHPLRYASNYSTIRSILNAMLEALSDDPTYVPTIHFEYKLRNEIDVSNKSHNFKFSLKDGAFEDGISMLDKIKESHLTGKSFRISGNKIKDFVIDDKEIKFDPEVGFIEIKPEYNSLPPTNIYIEDDKGNRIKYYDNIILVKERVVDGIVHLISRDDNPINFRLTIDTKTNKSTFGFKFNFISTYVQKILQFFKFQNELLSGKTLVFNNEKGEMKGKPYLKEIKPVPKEWLDLFEKLVYIQNNIGKPIYLDKLPAQEMIQDILTIYDLLTVRETRGLVPSFQATFKKKNITLLIDQQKKLGFIEGLKISIKEFGFSLFNYTITFGDALFEADKMEMLENITQVETKIVKMTDDEEIGVSFKIHKDANYKLSVEKLDIKVIENKVN